MENKLNRLTGALLVGFTCLVALALIANAAQALAGTAAFAYWHWVTLVTFIYFCRKAVPWVTYARWAVRIRDSRKRTARAIMRAILELQRAVRGLAAHFSTHEIQTEP